MKSIDSGILTFINFSKNDGYEYQLESDLKYKSKSCRLDSTPDALRLSPRREGKCDKRGIPKTFSLFAGVYQFSTIFARLHCLTTNKKGKYTINRFLRRALLRLHKTFRAKEKLFTRLLFNDRSCPAWLTYESPLVLNHFALTDQPQMLSSFQGTTSFRK